MGFNDDVYRTAYIDLDPPTHCFRTLPVPNRVRDTDAPPRSYPCVCCDVGRTWVSPIASRALRARSRSDAGREGLRATGK